MQDNPVTSLRYTSVMQCESFQGQSAWWSVTYVVFYYWPSADHEVKV